MSELKKPSFGVYETIEAFFDPSVERWRLGLALKYGLKLHPEFHHNVSIIRSEINQVLLSKRLPERNVDGSVNWQNFYAVAMELDRPISREEIFPEGTDKMSEREILERSHDFLKQYSAKWNFGSNTTAIDPAVLPEVIDADFRHIAMKINALPFVRTDGSCSGHPDGDRGFSKSYIDLKIDNLDLRQDKFLDLLKQYCKSFSQRDGIKAFVRHVTDGGDWGSALIGLSISAPTDWKETELSEGTKTPDEYLAELIPSYFKDNGYVNSSVHFDPKNIELLEKADQYNINYYRRKNCFNNSDACKKIRDDFWAGVGEIADSFR